MQDIWYLLGFRSLGFGALRLKVWALGLGFRDQGFRFKGLGTWGRVPRDLD